MVKIIQIIKFLFNYFNFGYAARVKRTYSRIKNCDGKSAACIFEVNSTTKKYSRVTGPFDFN